jgi:hypothetical protein
VPNHIVAVWLASLLWLEDGRWRKLRVGAGGAPTDSLEVLLDALNRRVLLLSLPAPADPPPPTSERVLQPQEQVYVAGYSPHAEVCCSPRQDDCRSSLTRI